MEIITVLFISADMEYARALSKCITEENPTILFTILTEEESTTLESFEKFDLILTDIKIKKEKEQIFLVEKRSETDKKPTSRRCVYKYDTAEDIANEIILMYCTLAGHKLMRPLGKKSKTVFFCSACGGSGKTSVALGLAQEMIRFHDKKILYISYEELESTHNYFKASPEKSVTNYLYYMKKDGVLSVPVESFVISDDYGVKTFSPSEGRNHLKYLNVEELSDFFNGIEENGDFDYIFIDSDNSLREESLWLFSACDIICNVEKFGFDLKEKSLKAYLTHVFGEKILSKMITAVNFADSEDSQREEGAEEPEKIFIENDSKSFIFKTCEGDGTLVCINIDKDFGTGIKSLSTKLTLNLQ